jgi:hypothetical protein
VGWQYEATDRLLSPDREWLGTTDPKSLLRALDKYLWFYGGGDANVAVVVKNPTGRVSSLLSEIRAREGAGG